MGYVAKVVEDSLAPNGVRLTTFELTYPRFVHSEFLTHRVFSRNAASSRAIPVARMIEMVKQDPAMPVFWGANQRGMQASTELEGLARDQAINEWLSARDAAVDHVTSLLNCNVHKQLANRLIEPWAWITVVCTATTFTNFFGLRCHIDAQPEIRQLALHMLREYLRSKPRPVPFSKWHLPYVYEDECAGLTIDEAKAVSVARCARVSYVRQGEARAIDEDVTFVKRLSSSGHWSPFEHVATPAHDRLATSGNFVGWRQHRQDFISQSGAEATVSDLNEWWRLHGGDIIDS